MPRQPNDLSTMPTSQLEIGKGEPHLELRHISWTVTAEVYIGYANCAICLDETPGPSMELLQSFARTRATPTTVWAGSDWMPAGWRTLPGTGLLCPTCAAAIDKTLEARRKKR